MLKSNTLHSDSVGFTLIELMVTVALIAVTLTLAAPSFSAFQRNAAVNALGNSLVANINSARGEAMKRGQNAFVVPKGDTGWQGGWFAYVDKDRTNSYQSDKDDLVLSSENPESFITITAFRSPAADTPPYLMFNAQGNTIKKDGSFASVVFCFDLTGGTCSLVNTDTRILIVSATGRPRLCRPATDGNCSTTSTS